MNKLVLMAVSCAVAGHLLGEDGLVSNIYAQVDLVYGSDKWDSPRDVFHSVRGGDGYEGGSVRKPFYALIPVVSNNYEKILQDWGTYATNEVVAFTVSNAAAYSGGKVLVSFVETAMSRYERTKSEDDWWTLKYLMVPRLTRQMDFMELNYDTPAVSNLIVRFRTCLESRGDLPDLVSWCDDVLSGDAKKYDLELNAAGVEF